MSLIGFSQATTKRMVENIDKRQTDHKCDVCLLFDLCMNDRSIRYLMFAQIFQSVYFAHLEAQYFP